MKVPVAIEALPPGPGLAHRLGEQLRAALHGGRIAAGARLPGTRSLALQLGVSRNTVLRAYEQLVSEGLLQGRAGAGYEVAGQLPLTLVGEPTAPQPATARWAQLRDEPRASASRDPAPFRHGIPPMDAFPAALWARLQARFWRRWARGDAAAGLGYGDPAGLPPLREAIAAYLRQSRGLACSAEQVLVTAGSQQAIALLALALTQPGDRVAMESPGYPAAAEALQLGGARVCPVPVDDQGLRPAALEALGTLRLAYLTPNHQYPTGVVTSLPRRLALLDWARRHEAWLIEDDYDGEYRLDRAPLPPLAALDPETRRTLYIGSFSKLLFPGLRLGYLVAPLSWLPRLAHLRSLLDRQPSVAEQATLAAFMAEGHFQRHVRRMRRLARERRDAFAAGWAREVQPRLPPALKGLSPGPLEVGLQAHAALPSLAWERVLVQAAAAAGVHVSGLSQLGLQPGQSQRAGVLLGFAAWPPDQLQAALRRLGLAWARADLSGISG